MQQSATSRAMAEMSEQDKMLSALRDEVERMPAFYEDAMKAREECRKRLDELHSDTMRQIQLTRDHARQKSKHVQDTMKSFTAKFEHELQQMRDELRKELVVKSARIEDMIADLGRRMLDLEEGLAQQTRERKQQTEVVLGPIRDEVDRLTHDLEAERLGRRADEEAIEKLLADKVELVARTVDEEKFGREQQYVDLHKWVEMEQHLFAKRQYQVEKASEENLRDLRHELHLETKDRIECQDTIVENIASFIKRFQEQLGGEEDATERIDALERYLHAEGLIQRKEEVARDTAAGLPADDAAAAAPPAPEA